MEMTGEEFKKLIEQRDTDGIVNTLQEILAAFEGIRDDETIVDYVKRVALTTGEEQEIGVGDVEARKIVTDAIEKAEEENEEEEDNVR